MSERTTPPRVWPTLTARDPRGLIRFMVTGLGFEETVVEGDGDQVTHAELTWPAGGAVMLGGFRSDAPDWLPQPGGGRTYMVTEDPDAVFERALAAGAEPLSEPQEMDYGSREGAVRDPEGNSWFFGTYQGVTAGRAAD